MKNNFNLGIEISDTVMSTSNPQKIKRYSDINRRTVKTPVSKNNGNYRYRPGVNSSMIGDLDV